MKLHDYRAVRTAGGVTPLAELLPLDTPLSLMIDPGNGCNFRCAFCPTGDPALLEEAGRKAAVLKLARYREIIAGLEGFARPIRVLHLYKDGEPLINRALGEMIAIAKASGRIGRIETTTNGALMTQGRARELIEAGLDGIRFSIYGVSDADYLAAARAAVPFARIADNVRLFFEMKTRLNPGLHVHCKIVDTGLDEAGRAAFRDSFGAIADSINIDRVGGWSGAHGARYAAAPRSRFACSELFTKLAVNADGTVSPCCADWAQALVIGDTARESLPEIWRGEALRALRLAQLDRLRDEMPACRSCGYIEALPDYADIDRALERLRPFYSAAGA